MALKPTGKLGKLTAAGTVRRPAAGSIVRSGSRYAAPPTARFVQAKTVGSYVPSLTRKAFEKFGFSTATLITDWTSIAGAELARYAIPERLKWPRGPAGGDETEDGDGRPGATLILRVDPARALDVEYKSRQIVQRINAYFGYRAVESLRLVQAPLPDAPPAKPLPHPANAAPQASGDPLHAALARLERGVLGAAARR
jgi:hypothetical protein